MNSLKLIKNTINLNSKRNYTKNLVYSFYSIDSIKNHNYIILNKFNNCNIFQLNNKRTFTSTSSFENVNDNKSVPFNSEHSDKEQCKSEYLMDKEEFLKILKLTGDTSSNLMNIIQKCKDDLHKLSVNSYPFKRYDLKILLQCLSGLLSIQNNKKDLDLLNTLLDSHNNDNKFTSGLDFCKIFSSSYDSVSKKPSPFLTKIANKGMMFIAKMFIPQFSEYLNEKQLSGVKFAFTSLSESINNQNMDTLEACCNTKLFNFIKNGIEFLNSLKIKMNLNINSIEQLILDKFYLTIGGTRADFLRDLFPDRNLKVSPVLVTNTKIERPKNTEEYRELFMKTLEKGAILRMEVIIFTNQSLSLMDDNNNTLWSDFKPFCTHRLCFESEFKVNSQYLQGKKLDFEIGDWILVDINGILNNNNPF